MILALGRLLAMADAAFAPRFCPGTLVTGTGASTCLILPEETAVTYHPRRRALSRILRKYHGQGPRSSDRNLRTQPGKDGKAELTSDMIVVGSEETCHSVTRYCVSTRLRHYRIIESADDKREEWPATGRGGNAQTTCIS